MDRLTPPQGRPGQAPPGTVVALFGPTSAGKTRLAVELGQRIQSRLGLEPVVISADSRQVYRYMDIGTSKTTEAERHGIRHEMIDVADPLRQLELERYVLLARGHLAAALRSGRLPLIVGGTGVYLAALLEGWEVKGTAAARLALRRAFPRPQAHAAHRLLGRLERDAARRVAPQNYEGVINALVVAIVGSRSRPAATTLHSPTGGQASPLAATRVVLGLDPGRRILEARISRTYQAQLRRGLIDEVMALNRRYDLERELRRRGRDTQNQVLHTHGYREFFELAAARGKGIRALSAADLAAVRELTLEHIRQYARRQRGWLRKLPGLQPIADVEQAFREVVTALRRPSSTLDVVTTSPKRSGTP
ncbi:MAG TPA: hypothetical protein VHS99_09175 [Chloroflexota bacterium]|nr:hypothetical protein [Chloroflexota bacterium]